jgi:hypothetical protein
VTRDTKSKKRRKLPLVRARRQKIDPTQFGSVRMTEDMLQAELVVVVPAPKEGISVRATPHEPPLSQPVQGILDSEQHGLRPVKTSEVSDIEFVAEHKRDLALLSQLFEGKDEWDGHEDDIEENGSRSNESAPEAEEAVDIPDSTSIEEEESSDDSESQTLDQVAPASNTTRLKDLFLPANAG